MISRGWDYGETGLREIAPTQALIFENTRAGAVCRGEDLHNGAVERTRPVAVERSPDQGRSRRRSLPVAVKEPEVLGDFTE